METMEQFSLCWNNFHTNLSSGFHSLLKDEDLVDVTLAAEGKFVKAHKTILSVCSPFFKELFLVNPCKHPIVILPDINFAALQSLLHFMYHGEVSVSQEEIPTFMKVAETLKVKGLTDSSTDASNGFPAKNSLNKIDSLRDEIIERVRPVKKLIRPIRPLRPLEGAGPPKSVKPSHSPQPTLLQPPVKKPHIELLDAAIQPSTSASVVNPLLNPLSPALSPTQTEAMSLIKPKDEPIDYREGDSVSHSAMELNLDLSNMLDTQLSGGEPSPSHQPPPWPTPGEMTAMTSEDSSQPGTIQLILGRRGNPRLIVDGYSFYKKSVYKGKVFWYCKNSRVPEKCQAVCWTMNGNIIKWPSAHNHVIFPDPFNPEEDSEVPIENLQEVLWQTSLS